MVVSILFVVRNVVNFLCFDAYTHFSAITEHISYTLSILAFASPMFCLGSLCCASVGYWQHQKYFKVLQNVVLQHGSRAVGAKHLEDVMALGVVAPVFFAALVLKAENRLLEVLTDSGEPEKQQL